MKKLVLLFLFGCIVNLKVSAQTYEIEQLLLDWAKLTQMKQILSDMKTGYEVLNKGYSTIRDISKGNFNLHEAFLDGLWLVSPVVRQYHKVTDIINFQVSLVKEYKSAFSGFKRGGWFNSNEISYMGKVYGNLFDQSLKNLDDLATIVTANKLRMSDDERLASIDKLYSSMQDKLLFLRSFNNSTSLLALQRAKEKNETNTIRQTYDLHP